MVCGVQLLYTHFDACLPRCLAPPTTRRTQTARLPSPMPRHARPALTHVGKTLTLNIEYNEARKVSGIWTTLYYDTAKARHALRGQNKNLPSKSAGLQSLLGSAPATESGCLETKRSTIHAQLRVGRAHCKGSALRRPGALFGSHQDKYTAEQAHRSYHLEVLQVLPLSSFPPEPERTSTLFLRRD